MKVTVNLNNNYLRNLPVNFSIRINWIKHVRELTGLGLKQTKDILDAAVPFGRFETESDRRYFVDKMTGVIDIIDEEILRGIRRGITIDPDLKHFISLEEKRSNDTTRQALIKAVTAGLKNGEYEAAKKVIELLEVL